ncbi:ankyrin repeat domain-containing protein [Paramagnetospirillum marisnigri]|uniref:ankyrin repeat domain-containing protein n=1 Tax=Paramagnetospirillum marisnigri TaxID=1285242 RepID=UPI00156158E9|nr:ankyrin repeat domain-containing protein [Paramagnetospirillum marisnigri]
MLVALAVIAVTVMALAADHYLYRPTIVFVDDRPGASQAPRRVLSRIQADLERVAVGETPWPLPPGVGRDPLERLVEAEDALLRGRWRAFHDHAEAVRAEALRRLARQDEMIRGQPHQADLDRVMLPLAYAEALTPPKGAEPLGVLVRTLRLVDAVLVLEAAETSHHQMRYDMTARRNLWVLTERDGILDGVRLRLPCPLVKGRAAAFATLAKEMGELAGPLLSCPVPDSLAGDFALLERLARHPADFARHAVPPPPAPPSLYGEAPPSPPWDKAAAIRFMDVSPDGAEPALRLATLDSASARLDLALFLHAFRDRSAARDEEIRSLMAGIDGLSLGRVRESMGRFFTPPVPYDGTDASLVPSLRLAAMTKVAESRSGERYVYSYAIPCAVLLARPALAAAMDFTAAPGPDDDSMTVDFTPAISGCLAGRGRVPGFPEADLAAFVEASAAADGAQNGNHPKTPRYPVMQMDLPRMAAVVFDPRQTLDWPEPVMEFPYQTWGYGSLDNHAAAETLRSAYLRARESLAGWFRAKGLSEAESVSGASRALFVLAHGSSCGDAPPPASLRRLLLERASVARMAELPPPEPERLKPFGDCARFAPFDPLVHLAVGHPALPLLWELAGGKMVPDPEGFASLRDVDRRNHFGKTPLMEAARFDLANAAAFLLDKGARVNADTWQTSRLQPLAHDSRTALIYAASNGSAATIRLLLAAGADRRQTDSKGLRAVHYLLGLGPLPANMRLSPAEREELVRALY